MFLSWKLPSLLLSRLKLQSVWLAFCSHLLKQKHFLLKQWILNVVCFLVPSRLVLGFDLLVYVFGKFPVVFCTWLCMFCATVIIPYSLFFQWAQGYSSSSHRVIYSLFYGTLFTLFQTVGLGIGPTYVAVSYALPPASRFIVILEQVSNYSVSLDILKLVCKTGRWFVVFFSLRIKCCGIVVVWLWVFLFFSFIKLSQGYGWS